MKENKELAQSVLDLFKILETVEESDLGCEFRPTTIRSCRIQHQMKLEELMPRIKGLAVEIINNQ